MPIIPFFPLQDVILSIFSLFSWFIVQMLIYVAGVYCIILELNIGWSQGYIWSSTPSLRSHPFPLSKGFFLSCWVWRLEVKRSWGYSGLWTGVGHHVSLLSLGHPWGSSKGLSVPLQWLRFPLVSMEPESIVWDLIKVLIQIGFHALFWWRLCLLLFWPRGIG